LRALLISTPHSLEENPLPPLSLAYLAGSLQREGFDVRILDFLLMGYRPEKVRQKLAEYRPHFVGVTCVTMNYPLASEMLRVCKAADPEVMTVIGGPHVSFAVDDTLLKSPWIDVVVIGEGDRAAVELARAVAGGSSITDVAGIAFAEEGVVVRTPPRPLVDDIDRLALPARDLVPLARYHALGTPCTVITSRGCPYGCLFCSASRMFGRKVRFRNPGLVVDEIEKIRKDHGFQTINIVDDTFTVNHAHVGAICEEIVRRNLDVSWGAYARVDNMTDDVAVLMKRAGCRTVLFGMESADEGILRTIGKGVTPADMRRGVKTASDAGLGVYNSFIIGLPGENAETIEKTRSFATEMNTLYGAEYGYHMLSPLPGTALYENAADHGLCILTSDWAEFDANRPIVETPTMSAAMAAAAMANYDEMIEQVWEHIKRGAAAGDETCIARLEGEDGRQFIWRLLQEDVIEPSGAAGTSGRKPGDAEDELASHIAHALDQPQERVRAHVRKLVDRGILRPGEEGWAWCEDHGAV